MILDVDETLRQMLGAELGRLPGCPVYTQEQITLGPPTEAAAAQDGEARVNLFLYDVRENLEQRNESFTAVRGQQRTEVGKRRAPVRMDLSYLVTTHAAQDFVAEHRLLGEVLGVLLRNPAAPTQYLTGVLIEHGAGSVRLAVAQPEHLEWMNPTNLWQALEGQIQPSLPLVVTASFDPFETKWTKVVRELVSTVGQGGAPDQPNRQAAQTSLRASAAGMAVDARTEQRLAGVAVRAEGTEEAAITDADGFFLLLNLPPGPATLRFEANGYAAREMSVTVPPPGRVEQMEPVVAALTLLTGTEREAWTAARETAARSTPDLAEAGQVYQASVTGTLLFGDGRPAARIAVSAGSQQTITDSSGIYCFFNLPPGEYPIQAALPGQGETEVARHIVPAHKKNSLPESL